MELQRIDMAQCTTPYIVRNKFTNASTPVPCGKCPNCVARRVSGWCFRLMQEDKVSDTAYFITLTYGDESCRRTRSGYLTLDKRDVQLFFKRLRKATDTKYRRDVVQFDGLVKRGVLAPVAKPKPIKYFAVGEYGGRTMRPHYHIIIFNADVELIQDAWWNPKLDKSMGHVDIGNVAGASVGYTMKYVGKKGKVPQHVNDDRLREFSLMSKGLGLSYFTADVIYWHKADLLNRVYCTVDGKKNSQCLDIIRISSTMSKRGS